MINDYYDDIMIALGSAQQPHADDEALAKRVPRGRRDRPGHAIYIIYIYIYIHL